ncbi:MAG TPA: bifunctional serine/threonine-protein kinase/universal stress protein [Anaeromyxobacteraceae bacterium]|nr:bifunctional serine/threonine-protein kinase/universal stress protein [Anaeromyxobacteraceae bacterium]
MPEPGEVVDGFRVEERIHSGGMGAIYRVRGPEPGPPLVMKVPRLGYDEQASNVVSYEVEQMVLGALRGPHVPRLVAAGDLAVRPYLVLEQVEGRSLEEWVRRAPIPAGEVARLGAAVATALHGIHVQEAIHLDLKPSNVIVRPGGEAVLLDFGLAHHAHYPDLLAEETRGPVGSAPYISPEQVMGERGDPRSDVFALGVVLYELATGRLPFGSPTTFAGLRQRLFRDPAPPRALVPDLPPWLQEIVLRCLEPEPEKRYGSAAQAALDLGHPDQVAVTERGRRTRRLRFGARLGRWLRAVGREPLPVSRPSLRLANAPIVVAAIATHHSNEALFRAVRDAVRRLLAQDGKARLAVVTVVRAGVTIGGESGEDTATGQRVKRLLQLRHWAEPLRLPAGRVSFHVLESGDTAEALLEYARMNQVDHVVLGAPILDRSLKGLVATVATTVAARAPCTVTVVRTRARPGEGEPEGGEPAAEAEGGPGGEPGGSAG